jgi:hypothetical protein
MKAPLKLATFVAGLGVAFAAAAGAGILVGPVTTNAPGHEDTTSPGSAAHRTTADVPKGLQVSQDGYTFAPQTTSLAAAGGTYAFRILDREGKPVTGYTATHDKDLHLIVVRRDLAGFAHVHPVMDADGTWRVPLRPAAGGGTYRVFADFDPAGDDGALTLGTDLPVAGTYTPRPLPAAERTATVDGYTVTLGGDLRPGTSSKLTLTIARDGAPVTDLQPYLGAYGHLVALRAGDLAYLHVHPEGALRNGTTRPGPAVAFYAEVPSAGDYRLYLDFQHDGVVRTAEFTATTVGSPSPDPHGGDHSHGD